MSRELLQKAYVALGGQWWAQDLCRQIENALAAPQPKPIAYGLPRADGLILDVITPEEHESYSGEYTVPLYAAPPAAPAEPCYCDRMGIGVPGVSCGDCPRDYKPAAPADMVMVPKTPTEDMIQAAADGWGRSEGGLHNAFAAALRAGIAAAPAPAVHPDEFTCPYCFDQGAAPAVPVSWDRLRILMDGIPTREEFIGGQRQKYVAKEAVMSWLHEGQLRAEREAAQPAAPAVQVVLRQPNLFAPPLPCP